jgi:hypothetical protein
VFAILSNVGHLANDPDRPSSVLTEALCVDRCVSIYE